MAAVVPGAASTVWPPSPASYFDLKKSLGCDLDQVVGEDAVPAPDRGSVPAVQAGSVPAVASFEVADPPFAAGSPLDQLAEAGAVLECLAGRGGRGLAGDRHG